jgi:hypothetical protein
MLIVLRQLNESSFKLEKSARISSWSLRMALSNEQPILFAFKHFMLIIKKTNETNIFLSIFKE